MTDMFTAVTAAEAAPDPSKHVHFVQGMVLGVEEFTQEFAYLSERDQWLAREALGYGVLRGLRVLVEPSGQGPRVRVTPGDALSVRGELVCVPEDQCAYLNPWLREHFAELAAVRTTLYVALCYRSCPTDSLPIPGEPCRDDDDLMAPSRLADSFRLELRTAAPPQREEDGLREFVAWLRGVRLEVALSPAEVLSPEDFAEAVRAAWDLPEEQDGSPPAPPFAPLTPAEELAIPAYEAHEYFRQALRVWVGDVRPRLRARGQACAQAPEDGCILLAALDLDLTFDRREVLAVRGVRDQSAPLLLHLRMLQEWLLAGWPVLLPGESVREERDYGLAADTGLAREFARADHTHGTPPLPALDGDVQSRPDPSPPFDDSEPTIFTTVTALQGRPVTAEAPAPGQALVFDGSVWHPGTVSANIAAGSPLAQRRYGQPSSPGTPGSYAPANHTHGTPPAPSFTPDSDVTAAVVEETDTAYRLRARVARLAGQPVASAAGGAAGQVLKLRTTPAGLEWAPGTDETGSAPPAPSFVLAAGAFDVGGGSLLTPFGGLKASPIDAARRVFLLTFDAADGEPVVVTGAPIASPSVPDPHVFEYLGTVSEAAKRLGPDDSGEVAKAIRSLDAQGVKAVLVRVQRIMLQIRDGQLVRIDLGPSSVGFTVEISRYK